MEVHIVYNYEHHQTEGKSLIEGVFTDVDEANKCLIELNRKYLLPNVMELTEVGKEIINYRKLSNLPPMSYHELIDIELALMDSPYTVESHATK